jgi:hypothetical protein
MGYDCEQKQNGYWIRISSTELQHDDPLPIRCAECHGEVRLHKQQTENGMRDHVEHKHRQDSKGCPKGEHFDGNHRMSMNPVE